MSKNVDQPIDPFPLGAIKRLIRIGNNADQMDVNRYSPVDIIVEFETGEKYASSFFSMEGINKLNEQHRKNGAFLAGSFFWTPHMIIVDNYEKDLLHQVVEYLIDEGDFIKAFNRV